MLEIDYKKYTLPELYDVQSNINVEAHPQRYEALIKEIGVREGLLPEKTPEIITGEFRNDPTARSTRWTPLKSGGSFLTSHYLERVSAQRVEFKVSKRTITFYLFFVIFLLAISIHLVSACPETHVSICQLADRALCSEVVRLMIQ